jgi:hypothetical protein
MGKHFCLPLQVDLCIDVGCVDRDMTEPRTDRDPTARRHYEAETQCASNLLALILIQSIPRN